MQPTRKKAYNSVSQAYDMEGTLNSEEDEDSRPNSNEVAATRALILGHNVGDVQWAGNRGERVLWSVMILAALASVVIVVLYFPRDRLY
jgi:hypothetical protein